MKFKNELLNELNMTEHYSIESSIPIVDLMENGILKGINNRYCKSFKLQDINYRLNDKEEQREILNNYKQMLNSFDETVEYQFSIFNTKLSDTYMDDYIYYKFNGDGLDNLREAANDTIRKNIIEDNKAFSKEKIITISTENGTHEKAIKDLKILEEVLFTGIEDIEGAKLLPLNSSEMLQYLNSIYNIKKKNNYYQKAHFLREDIEVFTMRNALIQGISAKELVQPSSMEFQPEYIKFGDSYIKALYLSHVNKQIDTEVIDKICSLDFNLLLTYKLKQIEIDKAIRMVEDELNNVEGEIFNNQRKLAEAGASADLVPRNMKQRRDEALDANDALKIRDEKYFDMSMYVLIFADSKEELAENTFKFRKIAKGKGLLFTLGKNIQENIFNSCLPYGLNQTNFKRSVDTEGAVAFIPFSCQDLMQPNGDFYGKNKLTNNPITFNIMSGDNYNVLILGESGKGKSFKAKDISIGRRLRNAQRDIIILDPNNEWGPLVHKLGGQEIIITAGGDNHINLFDIDVSYGDNPLSEKEDFIISVCKQMLHSPFGDVSAGQRTAISNAVARIYSKWSIKKVPENIPTLEDFFEALKTIANNTGLQEDYELCRAIEYYCGESQNTLFRGKTDIDTNNSITSYNLQNLGSDLKPLAMQIILDNIWTKTCRNKDRGIPTDVIIDEFHLMFRQQSTAEYMYKFWKMFRKFLGSPLGITQDPEDVLSSEFGRAVVTNTSLNIMLSLKDKNREIMKNELSLTNEQIRYIKNQPSGEGLLYIAANKNNSNTVVIPFKNPVSKDNLIYKLINTSYDFNI